MFLRHLLAFLALPFVVTVVVPLSLLNRASRAGDFGPLPFPVPRAAVLAAGVLLGLIGLALFVSSLRHFVVNGRGTLAPWDPPKALVVSGPYRFVRNPMISGVVFILFSEAALFFSSAVFGWAVLFLALNLVYIPLFEEPSLADRFGESYREYRAHVRRFLPRLTPWNPGGEAQRTGAGART